MNVPVILRRRRLQYGGGVAPFSPLSLFASGEEGVWYEPSTTTAFLSTTDLTPCGYGDACGFLLDKSQEAGYSGGSFTGLGSELIAGGEFNDPADVSEWTGQSGVTLSFDSGELKAVSGSTNVLAYQDITTTVGKTYVYEADLRCVDAGTNVLFRVYTTGFSLIAQADLAAPVTTTRKARLVFVATQTTTRVSFGAISTTYYADNISVREPPGNHATQGTADARPILARVPEGGRRNLLEYTEDFNNGYWTKDGASVTTSGALTNGGISYDLITQTENWGITDARIFVTTTTGTNATIHAKAGTNDKITIRSVNGLRYAIFDLTNGTVDKTNLNVEDDAVITPLGDGYYRCEVIAPSDIPNFYVGFYGTAGETVYIGGAQLEASSSATAYQKVVNEYDITEAGVDSLDYLSFDGTDDFMTSGTNADWKYLHDGTGCEFVMGLRPSESADTDAFEAVWSTFNSSSSSVGSLFVVEDRVSQVNQAWTYTVARGVGGTSTFSVKSADTITSLIENYVVRGGHKSGETPEYFLYDDEVLEHSGSYADTPSTANSQGELHIGKLASGTNNWNGRLFGLIIRDTQLTTQQRSDTSSYMANRSGVSLA